MSGALAIGCGSSGDDESTSTTVMTMTTFPMTQTTPMTDDTGTPDTMGETGGSSSTNPTTSATDPATTDTPTTTSVDPSTTSGTNPSSTSAGDSTTDTGGMPCDEFMATLNPVKPNIMFVLDKSGSMVSNPNGYWDHDNDPNTPTITRWNSLYQVVSDITMAFDDKANFGANLFPSTQAMSVYTVAACPVNNNVEVDVAPMNSANILGSIPGQMDTSLKGGTPSAAGVAAGLNHLKSLDPNVPRAIFLVTDGAANCRSDAMTEMERFETYDQSLHTIVSDAWTMDVIPTYVIGIAINNMVTGNQMDGNPNGINPFEKLNELAMQGGVPKNDPNEQFYNATNQLELQAALDAVIGDALSCIIPLEEPPGFPDFTEVVIEGMEIPHVTDCASEDGWVYTDDTNTAIELCGAACTELKMAGAADINYFCMPN